jgi:hypothetical protein
MTTAAQLSDAAAIAVADINKEIPSLLTKANARLAMLMANKKKTLSATLLQFPINCKKLNNVKFINGITDTIDLNPGQQITNFQLNWKHMSQPISITLDDMAQASGGSPHVIADLFVTKKNLFMGDVARYMSDSIETTGYLTNANRWNGFADIFAASGTQYGGLTNTDTNLFASSTDWLTDIDSSTQTVSFANINKQVQKLRSRCQGLISQNTGKMYDVDKLYSNYAVRAEFMAQNQVLQRFAEVKDLVTGFDIVKVAGCEWFVDQTVPGSQDGTTADNYLYMVTSNSMGFKYVFGFDNPSPFDQSAAILPNQPILFDVKYLSGNIYCENRRVNGVMTTLVA